MNDTFNLIKRIKLEIKFEMAKKNALNELNSLENYIINSSDNYDTFHNLLIIYTQYVMKFLSLINIQNDILLENLMFKKLNMLFTCKKIKMHTILEMQEIIDTYFINQVNNH